MSKPSKRGLIYSYFTFSFCLIKVTSIRLVAVVSSTTPATTLWPNNNDPLFTARCYAVCG